MLFSIEVRRVVELFHLMEKIITLKKDKVLVGDHFTNPETLKKLPGNLQLVIIDIQQLVKHP